MDSSASVTSEEGNKVYQCHHCNKICKNEKGLGIHLGKCGGTDHTLCKFCNRRFFNRRNLNRHLVTCKALTDSKVQEEKKQTQSEMKKFQTELKQKDQRINQMEKQQNKMINQYEERLQDTKLLYNEMFRKYEEVCKKYEETLKELSKRNQFITTNNITNSTTLNQNLNVTLKPVETDNLKLIIRDLLLDNSIKSEQSFARHIFRLGLKDKVVLVDSSRGIVNWVDENNTNIRDKKATALTNKLYDLGSDLFQEKKDELEETLGSLHEDCPEIVEEIDSQRKFCNRVVMKNTNSIKEFGKEIVSLALDKSAIHLVQQQEEDPFEVLGVKLKQAFEESGGLAFVHDSAYLGSFIAKAWKDLYNRPVWGEEQLVTTIDSNRTITKEDFQRIVVDSYRCVPDVEYKFYKHIASKSNELERPITVCFDQVRTLQQKLFTEQNAEEWDNCYFSLLL